MDSLAAQFERFRSTGDLQALGFVFDASAPRLLAIALHLCGDPADAEDALQQTFVLAMQRAATFDASRPLEPWLAGLLTNVAHNARRRDARRQTEPLPELAGGETPVAAAERAELVAQLRAHIDGLPAEQRQALLLQLQHGLSAVDIAEVLQVPPGTVRMRLHRGIEALRRLLPAGLALLVLGALPGRGLAAVRQAVLQAGHAFAATVIAAAVTPVLVGGAVAMKKFVCAALLLLVVAFGWWWSVAAPEPPVVPTAVTEAAAAAQTSLPQVLPQTPVPEALATERSRAAVAEGSLRIHVVASAGSAVSDGSTSTAVGGALLYVWPGTEPLVPFGDSTRTVVTDDAGEAELQDLPVGPWQVQLAADAEAARPVVVHAAQASRVEIVRSTSSVARGIVVDFVGAPVAGAEVWVHRGTAMGAYSMPEPAQLGVRRAAVTDLAGRFVVPVGPRESRLGATARGHGASFGQSLAGNRGELRLVLGREHGTLAGTVRDPLGQPVAAAFVSVVPAGQDPHRAADGSVLAARVPVQARTDALGCFLVEGLPPGTTKFWASAQPHYPGWGEVTVPAFGKADVAIVLPAGISVTGTVRLADGTPVRVAMAARPQLDPNGHFTHADTREDGSYRMDHVPARTFYVTVGGRIRGFLAHREFRNPVLGMLQCDFVLEDHALLRGRVVDAAGSPLGSWRVWARDEVHTVGDTTDSAGAFALLLPKSAAVELAAAPALHGNLQAPPVVRGGVRADGPQVVLAVPAAAMPRAVVRGRLVDRSGQGLAARAVLLRREDDRHSSTQRATTRADGAFEFRGVAAARFEVRLGDADWLPQPLGVAATSTEPVVELGDLQVPVPAVLRVEVQRADGTAWLGPLPTLRTRDHVGRQSSTSARAVGTVLEMQLEGGRYEVELTGADLAAPRATVELTAGESRQLSMRVAIGRSRSLVCNGDGRDKPARGTVLSLCVRTADGTVVVQRESVDQVWNLRGFFYWSFDHVFGFGDYVVEAHTASGLRYRTAFTVREDLADAARIDVPFVLQ